MHATKQQWLQQETLDISNMRYPNSKGEGFHLDWEDAFVHVLFLLIILRRTLPNNTDGDGAHRSTIASRIFEVKTCHIFQKIHMYRSAQATRQKYEGWG